MIAIAINYRDLQVAGLIERGLRGDMHQQLAGRCIDHPQRGHFDLLDKVTIARTVNGAEQAPVAIGGMLHHLNAGAAAAAIANHDGQMLAGCQPIWAKQREEATPLF